MEGLCKCGCGKPTTVSSFTDRSHGYVKGQPRDYIKGHAGAAAKRKQVRYVIDPGTGCWEWQLAKRDGYGVEKVAGKVVQAHRRSYEEHKGPIPRGLEPDHLCRNRACINPDHLEVVTKSVNSQRRWNRDYQSSALSTRGS